MKVKSSDTADFLLRSHMWKFTEEEKKRDTSYQRGEFRGNKTWSPGVEQQMTNNMESLSLLLLCIEGLEKGRKSCVSKKAAVRGSRAH